MMIITSPAFAGNSIIPRQYTCDGDGVSPALTFDSVPANTKSLILIMDDPDAPGQTYVHWVIFNIVPETKGIGENGLPDNVQLGKTSAGQTAYVPPCPPSGTHRYFFRVYALDTVLDFKTGASRDDLERALNGHVLDQGELVGLYSRS